MTNQNKKMNVESFNLDHTKVKAPYVRLAGKNKGANGDEIYKYDLRFLQPIKKQKHMPSLHSLEHLMAELIRNHSDKVIDVGPMVCQTGYYLSVINHDYFDAILQLVEKTLIDVLAAKEVPACNVVQCGWAESHSLEGAQTLARNMLAKKEEWTEVFA